MKYYAGLDIGGTNGRLKISAEDGSVLGEFTAPGCSINTDGYEKSRLRYRGLVLPALESLGLKAEDCAGICVAASGIDSEAIAASCRKAFEEMGFVRECLHVMNDCEVVLHLSKGPALVIISGTGSICYGRDSEKKIYRTGGWNHIISDEGSGFDLGLKFLQAAANDLDGRIKAPVLTSMIIEETGLDNLDKMNDFVNRNLLEKAQIARLSKTGYEAAGRGDEEALRILEACADVLYALIRDTCNKMGSGRSLEADLWLWGSVLVKNDILRNMLTDKLQKEHPALTVKIPDMSALDIALMAAKGE